MNLCEYMDNLDKIAIDVYGDNWDLILRNIDDELLICSQEQGFLFFDDRQHTDEVIQTIWQMMRDIKEA